MTDCRLMEYCRFKEDSEWQGQMVKACEWKRGQLIGAYCYWLRYPWKKYVGYMGHEKPSHLIVSNKNYKKNLLKYTPIGF